VIVLTSIANAIITLVVFALIISIFLVASGHAPTPVAMAWFLIYCVALAAIVVGFSLATSVLFLRYRDLNQVWDVVIQAGFFIAPIVYPLDIIPERYHLLLYVWPPTPVIQFARAALVTGALPTPLGHLCLLADAATCLAVGVVLFRWLSPRAAEYV
jgi:lipopolysaccharide transport system permease protein